MKGDRGSDKVFNDDIRADTHENISDTALHRDVDFLVYEAGRSGLIDTYIICPPLIYGVGAGPFNRSSIQIPEMIRTSLKYGKSVHVGKGENVWSNVYIEDLANFFILILEKALTDEAPKVIFHSELSMNFLENFPKFFFKLISRMMMVTTMLKVELTILKN